MTYFFIWTTLNRKVGGLLRGEGSLLWVRLASFIYLFFYYFNSLCLRAACTLQTLPQTVIHITQTRRNIFLTGHNIGHLSPTAETTLLRYTVFLED